MKHALLALLVAAPAAAMPTLRPPPVLLTSVPAADWAALAPNENGWALRCGLLRAPPAERAMLVEVGAGYRWLLRELDARLTVGLAGTFAWLQTGAALGDGLVAGGLVGPRLALDW